MFKSSKYILAGGCSFTDEDFTSVVYPEYDTSFDKWPSILGDMLELNVKNLGRSGAGNDYIFDSLVKDISANHKNIELVVVGWSDMQRFTVYDIHLHNPESGLAPSHELYRHGYHLATEGYYMHLWNECVSKKAGSDFGHLWRMASEATFSRMVALQKLCKAFNIKLIQSSIHGVFNRSSYKHLSNRIPDFHVDFCAADGMQAVMSTKSFYEVDPIGVIGWPFIRAFGGWEFGLPEILTDDKIISRDPERPDWHPNKKGHEFIAEKYAKEYKEVYL